MSFLDKIKKAIKPEKAADENTFVFETIPATIDEFKAKAADSFKNPNAVIALAVVALNIYPVDAELAYEMLNVLKGPAPLSAQDKALIKDQLRDKEYLPRSYFAGATPENNYEPSEPATITVNANPHSNDVEGYYTAYVVSGGADNPRPVTVRLKASTGEWFLHNHTGLLPGIRKPAEQDPWA